VKTDRGNPANAVRLMLAASGTFLVLMAVVFNRPLVGLLVRLARRLLHRPAMQIPTWTAVGSSELAYAVAGATLILASITVSRHRGLSAASRHPRVQKTFLAILALLVPFFTLEVAVRPFSERFRKETSLFIRDDSRGWRLRPGASDHWGGVPVTINGKGVRGPEIEYEKPERTARVLFLGDSVTFGFKIEDDEDTLPAVVESILNRETGGAVQSINAGCGGYSPWQEFLYLSQEGYKYEPDVVVVGFVLNDVTEKFGLVKFGGTGESVQLMRSYNSMADRLLARSALITQVRRVVGRYRARSRLGSDVRKGAIRLEVLNVGTLIDDPDRPELQAAWEITLMNLGQIFDYCRERDIDARLVIFPFRVQLDSPRAMAAPQKRLTAWASARGIPTLDLLGPLAEMVEQGHSPESVFLDHDHFSVDGTRLVAPTIAEFVKQGLASPAR